MHKPSNRLLSFTTLFALAALGGAKTPPGSAAPRQDAGPPRGTRRRRNKYAPARRPLVPLAPKAPHPDKEALLGKIERLSDDLAEAKIIAAIHKDPDPGARRRPRFYARQAKWAAVKLAKAQARLLGVA